MSTKTTILLIGGAIAMSVSVAYAMDQQIYQTIVGLRADVRQILSILLRRGH